ncbi:hypothetical protein FB45DRAFT_548817 [Roridomyces roridus]|uniref:Uncharacterized protein n=1 Tax=Roridomyces roridus TaxID=1738132 RepID=A0AAD7FPL9_9AGAR|nr:hypothetical protein FB45DRAFT_548817 [Roridomyces roridus]
MTTHEDERSNLAARRIQRAWRNSRKSKPFLTTSVRLDDAKTHAAMMASRQAADAGLNTARARWRRAINFTRNLQDGNSMLTENGLPGRAPAKFMETQHWLELVDGTDMAATVEFSIHLWYKPSCPHSQVVSSTLATGRYDRKLLQMA